MKKHTFTTLLFILILLAASPLMADRPLDTEIFAGEKLEFRIRWGFITAGAASLEVSEDSEGWMTFSARAQSLPVLDAIYPVRNLMESTVELPGVKTRRYYKRVKEGWGKERDEEMLFDPAFGHVRHFKRGKLRHEVKVPEGVQDPLSCLYWYRIQPAKGTLPVYVDIADGSRLVTGSVSILRKERVETPAGTFDTVVVEPRMEGIGGVFEKSPGARIFVWLTDDARRMPVKLQSEVMIGSFTAELTAYHSGQGGVTALLAD